MKTTLLSVASGLGIGAVLVFTGQYLNPAVGNAPQAFMLAGVGVLALLIRLSNVLAQNGLSFSGLPGPERLLFPFGPAMLASLALFYLARTRVGLLRGGYDFSK